MSFAALGRMRRGSIARPRRRARAAVALALALALLAMLSSLLLGACNGAIQKATRVEHQAFPVAAGAHTDLSVTTLNGHINVTGKGDGTADVTITLNGTGPSMDAANQALNSLATNIVQSAASIDATVTSTGDLAFGSGHGADVDVFLPPDASLTLVSSNGRIEAVNVMGTVTATTSNGAVVTRSGHDLQLTSSNGSITMTDPAGTIVARTSNASVDILNAGSVIADVETSNGAIAFSGRLAAGDHRFTTSNASLGLKLPGDQGFSLDAQTSNASVTTDFPGLSVIGTTASGSTGDGSAHVRAQTSNGALSVTRLQP